MRWLISPGAMRGAEEKWFRESGVPSIAVMERAAQALADAISGELPEGAFYAEVALANDGSTLNLRAEPNTTAQVLYPLMNGQPLIVLRELGDGWVQVQVGSYTGYVAAQYLRLI